MRARGLDYRHDPVSQSLRRIGVGGVIDTSVTSLPRHVDRPRVTTELEEKPRWILVRDNEKAVALLPTVDLVRAVTENTDAATFDLLGFPASRLQIAPIHLQATLQEALETMESTGAEALYVRQRIAPRIERVYGVLTRQDIERNYRV